jgi:hypothetical protein
MAPHSTAEPPRDRMEAGTDFVLQDLKDERGKA